MNKLISNYLEEIRATRAPKTFHDYQARMRNFDGYLWALPTWDRSRAVSFLSHLTEKGTGPASVALHEATISAFYSWLVKSGVIEKNPLAGKALFPLPPKKRPEQFMFTELEYKRIKRHLSRTGDGAWFGAVTIGWNTGLRLGDVLRLGAEHLKKDAIVLTPNKTIRSGIEVRIPASEELWEWLEPRQSWERFIPTLWEDYRNNAWYCSKQFERILERSNVKGKSFHGFRHTFVSRLLNKGVPLPVVSSMTGQSLIMLQKYSHVGIDDQRKAIEKL